MADEPRDDEEQEVQDVERPTMGDFNVVLGPSPASMGSGNVYVRDADSHGNVMHNARDSEAIGFKAHAGPGGKAIGAFANAGGESDLDTLVSLLEELAKALNAAGDATGVAATTELVAEVPSPERDASAISRAWGLAKAAATVNGLTALVLRIEPLIHALIG